MTDRSVELAYDEIETWKDRRGYTLSDRVWRQGLQVRRRIDAELRQAIANGETPDVVARRLRRYLNPRHRSGASYAATRLASNEIHRAHAVSTQWVAMSDPFGGYLRYRTSANHAEDDDCTQYAGRLSAIGTGVYPAKDCPLPPIHVNCGCRVEEVGVRGGEMMQRARQLRVEYGLDTEPTNLSPGDLASWRRQTRQLREQVRTTLFGYTQQTGLYTLDQALIQTSRVADWVRMVRNDRAMGRRTSQRLAGEIVQEMRESS